MNVTPSSRLRSAGFADANSRGRSGPRSRKTLRRVIAGSVAIAGITALVACSSSSEESDAGSGSGGIARIAISTDVSPAAFYAGAQDAERNLRGLVYDSLIRYQGDSLDPQPALAEQWEVSEDGLEYTLQLREGVTFHDGREFTSEDVRASLEAYSDPSRTGQLASTAGQISEFDTSDPHVIGLTLKEPVNNFFDLLDIVPIIDKNDIAGFESGENYNGTGAFRLTDWQKGSKLELEANDDYWDGAPELDGVELLVIPDPQTSVSQLRSGQIDVLSAVSPRDRGELSEDPNYTIQEQVGVNSPTYAGFNVDVPGLDDVRVRQAIAYAVDRDRILAEAYQGYGSAISLPWPEQSPAFDAEKNDHFSRDLDKSRELLEEVGDIPPFTLSYPSTSRQLSTVAQIVQDNLSEVGIEVNLEGVEPGVGISHLRNGTFPGIWILNHGFTQYNPSTLVSSAFPFNAQKNGSNFQDPKYTDDVRAAWLAADPTGPEALTAYEAVNDDLLEYTFITELVGQQAASVSTSTLEGIEWTKKSEIDLSDARFVE